MNSEVIGPFETTTAKNGGLNMENLGFLEQTKRGWTAWEGIQETATFTPTERSLFVTLGNLSLRCWIIHKNPQYDTREGRVKWNLVSRRLDELRHSLAAVCYHLENIKALESKLDQIFEEFTAKSDEGEVPCGICYWGVKNKITFEYHAMIFATVRACTYLAFAVSDLFPKKCPNLLALRKHLEKLAGDNSEYTESVQIIRRHETKLALLFSAQERKSVRDIIAHERFMPVGSLYGGGSRALFKGRLLPNFGCTEEAAPNVYRLSEVLDAQYSLLSDFMTEFCQELSSHFIPLREQYPDRAIAVFTSPRLPT